MYHSITQSRFDKNINAGGKHIDLVIFERQIKYLSKNKHVTKTIKETLNKNILITFDDGFENNYTNAYPLFKKYNIPFILFINTGLIDGKLIWTDELLKISLTVSDFYEKTAEWFAYQNLEIKLPITYNSLRIYLKDISVSLRRKYLHDFRSEKQGALSNEYHELFTPLNWTQIKEMVNSGLCEVGAHTENHPILSQLTYGEQYQEINTSIMKLENKLSRKIFLFAYPNGRNKDFNDDTMAILKNLGINYAFTTESGKNNLRDHPYELHRYGITSNLPFWNFWVITNDYWQKLRT
ncbi:MAG: polysaccharide deacetylase family protein [Bacteroidetes bacterium]|nr:polysaccharide deacetylase family protein [Bacteroidota bacterium]